MKELPIALDRPLVFMDLETTGLNIQTDRIVEVAIIRVSPGGDVLERERRFNPGIPIPPEATAVHGITDEDVAGEDPFSARARALAELLDPCDLAGFNIRGFDLPMLCAEFKRAGVDFDPKSRRIIDMKAIFHREEPRDLSAAARFYLDREHSEAHTALGDTRITAEVLWAQLERYPHIPRDVDGLQSYCDEFMPFETELQKWFRTTERGLVFRRGKHRETLLSTVAGEAPGYLAWMLRLDDLDDEVRRAVQDALDRAAVG